MNEIFFWAGNVLALIGLAGFSIWPRCAANRHALQAFRLLALLGGLSFFFSAWLLTPSVHWPSGLAVCIAYAFVLYAFQYQWVFVRRIIDVIGERRRLQDGFCLVRPSDRWFFYQEPMLSVSFGEGAGFQSSCLAALSIRLLIMPDSLLMYFERGDWGMEKMRRGDTARVDPEICQKIEAIARDVLSNGRHLQDFADHFSDPPTAPAELAINAWLSENVSPRLAIRLEVLPEVPEEQMPEGYLPDGLASAEKY